MYRINDHEMTLKAQNIAQQNPLQMWWYIRELPNSTMEWVYILATFRKTQSDIYNLKSQVLAFDVNLQMSSKLGFEEFNYHAIWKYPLFPQLARPIGTKLQKGPRFHLLIIPMAFVRNGHHFIETILSSSSSRLYPSRAKGFLLQPVAFYLIFVTPLSVSSINFIKLID